MSNISNEDLNRYASMLKALSNPNRLSIFLRLASCCAAPLSCSTEGGIGECVGELGKDMGIAPSTVSHHIKELNRCGLLTMERRGKSITCRIDSTVFAALLSFLGAAGDRS